eukprot:scaffold31476_cov121-Isochrysis_galbana.AAC.2
MAASGATPEPVCCLGRAPVRRVDVGLGVQEEADQLNVPSGQGVVERRASAPVLPVVRVAAALDQPRRNVQPRAPVGLRVALSVGNLVQPAIKISLVDACRAAARGRKPLNTGREWRAVMDLHSGERHSPSSSSFSTVSISRYRMAQMSPDSSPSKLSVEEPAATCSAIEPAETGPARHQSGGWLPLRARKKKTIFCFF